MRIVSQLDAERIARGSKSLADPTRVLILSVLTASPGGRAYVSQLATVLGFSQPTITHHLRKLEDDGVVERTVVGRQAWYTVAPHRVIEVVELLGGVHAVEPVSEAVLARISNDVAGRFGGIFSAETVARYVHDCHVLLLEKAQTTRHLSSLTARFAVERLSALARTERVGPGSGASLTQSDVPEVLFVCVKNAGRSQLAAAILTSLVGDRVRARSAGSEPAGFVNPLVIEALDEIGVSIEGEFPKPLTDEVVRAADVVVTMGCGDACPIYPGRRYLDWELADPLDLPLREVRAVRDAVERHVRELAADLGLLQEQPTR